jgi:hypothetical protein
LALSSFFQEVFEVHVMSSNLEATLLSPAFYISSCAFQVSEQIKSITNKMSPMKRRELTDEERSEAERLNAAWLSYKGANAGATQTWLGAESGIGSQGAVGQYLRGAIPLNIEALMGICRVIGAEPGRISPRLTSIVTMNFDDIMEGLTVRSADQGDPEFVEIPMVKLRLQAGITGFQTEPDRRGGGTLGMRKNWLERHDYNPAKLVAIHVKGESMEPSLYEDDVVVINTADTKLVDGQVYAVNYEGEAVVKRLARDAGDWWLTSDNPDQRKHHRKICRGDACIVIGRVVRKESDRI